MTPAFFPQRLSKNALSTFFGTSADTDVQDNKFSTNTAQTAISVETPYDLQFKKRKHPRLMSETRRRQLFQPETFLMNFQHRCESLCSYKKTDFTLIMVQVIRSNLFEFYCIKGHTIDFLEVLFTNFPSSSIGIFFFQKDISDIS